MENPRLAGPRLAAWCGVRCSNITRQQLAEALGLTTDGVKYHLRKLREEGRLRRSGPDKGRHWEVDAAARDVHSRRSKGR